MEDNKGRFNYYCKYCTYKCRSIETIKTHFYVCIEKISNLQDGIDFVICKKCNFHAQNLGIHLKKIHNLNVNDYDGITISKKSFIKYSKNHFQYLKNMKENNVDLTNYWKKVSKGVSLAILSNPIEIKRRAEMMHLLNNKQQLDPIFKKLVSDTAIKTSARPDIKKLRAKNLENWRKEFPEDFYNKCTKPMITTFQSKPEKKLFEFVSNLSDFTFKRNQFINSLLISNKSHNKQIDIGDKEKRIYIEFDGVFHFLPKYGNEVLFRTQQKDNEVEVHILNHNWTLIRISYDQFRYKTKIINKVKYDMSYFIDECLEKLIKILNNKEPGLYKIGESYGKY